MSPRHHKPRHPRYQFLTREEEQALFVRFQETGDERALHAVVVAHMPLVRKAARDMKRSADATEDLVQDGAVGLMIAARRFDPSRNLRFATFARWWVNAMIKGEVFKESVVVHPRHSSARRRFYQGDHLFYVMSLDNPLPDDPIFTFADTVASDEPSPEDAAEASVDGERNAARLARALQKLRGRDRAIFEARHLQEEQPTLDELGRQLGVSKERVRQIEMRALNRVRAEMKEPA